MILLHKMKISIVINIAFSLGKYIMLYMYIENYSSNTAKTVQGRFSQSTKFHREY